MRKITEQTIYFKNRTGGSFTVDRTALGAIVFGNGHISGSGFVVDNKNQVATCAHVVDRNQDLFCKTSSKQDGEIPILFKLELIKYLPEYDLALLKSEEDLCEKPLNAATNFNITLEEVFYYCGYDTRVSNSQGINFKLFGGMVSSIGKTKLVHDRATVDYFDHVGHGVPGFSGGVVINLDGDAIAVSAQAWNEYTLHGNFMSQMNRVFSLAPLFDVNSLD